MKMTVREILMFNCIEVESGCWEWQGGKSGKNYGSICINGKNWLAHRLSYNTLVGLIPKGKHVLHNCDNPPCINPSHLYIGTAQDNMNDKYARGRSNHCGEDHLDTPLLASDIRRIRRLKKDYTLKELGAMYGVSHIAIWKIVHRRSWKSVK